MFPAAAEIIRLLGGVDAVTEAIQGGQITPGPSGVEITIKGGPMIRDIPAPPVSQAQESTPEPPAPGRKGQARPAFPDGRAWDKGKPETPPKQRHRPFSEVNREARQQRARIERVVITRNFSDGYSLETFGSMSATKNVVSYNSHIAPEQLRAAFTNATGVPL
jgi:hypothetical protein